MTRVIASKNFLDIYFHTLIIKFFLFAELKFRIEKKVHAKVVVDVFRDDGGAVFFGDTWMRGQ